MPIGFILLILLLGGPLLEIAVFIAVGSEIGILPTLLLILATSTLGAVLLRAQGFAALRQIARESRGGGLPLTALGHAALIGIGGFFLLLPGFVSDVLGILLFLPPVRSLILKAVASHGSVVVMTRPGRTRDDVIDLDPAEWRTGPARGPDAPPVPGRLLIEDGSPGELHRR